MITPEQIAEARKTIAAAPENCPSITFDPIGHRLWVKMDHTARTLLPEALNEIERLQNVLAEMAESQFGM